MASQKQLMEIPLATGLATKDDPRAMAAPGLAVCEDVQFDELGGIQTRPQFQAITDAAGNTIADIRKIEAYGDELVAFSKDKLWSYASGDGLWTQRAEYLAVKVEEVANFVTTAEQFDCDRATLGGITMYVWTETTPTATLSYVAAIDTATGSVKLTPESLGASVVRPRVTATTNKLIVTFYNGTVLSCKAYTPSTLASVTSSTLTTTGGMYDVMVHDTATKLIGVTNDGTTGYIVFEISEAGLYSSLSTRTVTVDSAMSIAQTPTATDFILVCYSNGTSIRGDLIDFAGTTDTGDIVVGTAANTPIGQISSVWNADDSLFYMFYSCSEVVTSSSTFEMEFNTLNTSASAGTEARVIKRAGMASHAFVHDTSVYVWVVFAGQSTGDLTTQLQNTYFLYRSDGALIAKAVPLSAGGLAPNIGHIPSV